MGDGAQSGENGSVDVGIGRRLHLPTTFLIELFLVLLLSAFTVALCCDRTKLIQACERRNCCGLVESFPNRLRIASTFWALKREIRKEGKKTVRPPFAPDFVALRSDKSARQVRLVHFV
jgi:hypothetical protein